ncbi:MAG: Gfo/Idh/MocA family protein [Chloroflexota bacterium]
MIRIGIVGYGYAGRNLHSYLINRVPDLSLAAVATRSPERRALAEREQGVPTFASLEEMIERGGIDLVVVATPHHTHAPLSILAMDAGRHVVTDKAMCLTVAEADDMITASRRNGVLLSIFQNRRWDWDYLTVKKVIEEGLLGAPYLFEVAVTDYKQPHGWRGDLKASGGIYFDWGAHLIDQALQLVPAKVRSVTCDAQYLGWGSEIGSYVRLLLRFENGVLYGIEVGNLCRAQKPRWRILGERGGLEKYGDPRGEQEPAILAGGIDAAVENMSERARIRTEIDGLSVDMTVESIRSDWTDYYRNIADVLMGRGELAIKPEQVRQAITVLEAAAHSAANGGRAVDIVN